MNEYIVAMLVGVQLTSLNMFSDCPRPGWLPWLVAGIGESPSLLVFESSPELGADPHMRGIHGGSCKPRGTSTCLCSRTDKCASGCTWLEAYLSVCAWEDGEGYQGPSF